MLWKASTAGETVKHIYHDINILVAIFMQTSVYSWEQVKTTKKFSQDKKNNTTGTATQFKVLR